MVYVPKNWVNGVDSVNAANLNHIEQGVGAAEEKALKGAVSGYAPLGADSKVPAANLPPIPDLAYQGVYSGATAYKDGDVVAYNGVLYMCVTPTTGSAPEDWGAEGASPWFDWAPVYGGTAGATVVDSGDSRNHSRYRIVGKACEFKFARILTVGGTAPNDISATLPPPVPLRIREQFAAEAQNLNTVRCGTGDALDKIHWTTNTGNFVLGTHWWTASGRYEIA